jgi:phosphoenolpyruvate carboxykinase (GTP)
MRVLRWVRDQVKGNADATSRETPVGIVPTAEAVGGPELGIPDNLMEDILSVNREEWLREAEDQLTFLETFGDHLPAEIREQNRLLQSRLSPDRA